MNWILVFPNYSWYQNVNINDMCIDPSAPRSHGFNKHSQVLLSLGWETVQLHWNPIRASLLRHQSIATYCQPFLAASSPRAHALSSLSPLSEFPTSISLKHFLSVGKDPKKIKREITCACVIVLRKRKNEKAHMLCPNQFRNKSARNDFNLSFKTPWKKLPVNSFMDAPPAAIKHVCLFCPGWKDWMRSSHANFLFPLKNSPQLWHSCSFDITINSCIYLFGFELINRYDGENFVSLNEQMIWLWCFHFFLLFRRRKFFSWFYACPISKINQHGFTPTCCNNSVSHSKSGNSKQIFGQPKRMADR